VLLLCVGVLMAIPPSVSQLAGAGPRAEVAHAVAAVAVDRAGDGPAAGVGDVVFAAAAGAIGIVPEVRPPRPASCARIAFGAPALSLYFCLRYLAEGLQHTTPSMFAGLAACRAGAAGLRADVRLRPGARAGRAGLGIATAIILWAQVLGFLVFLRRSRRFAAYELFARFEAPHWPTIRGLLALGLPMGVSIFMEGSLFVATAC
jgi:MATE family multidrug resistance protein